jgi:hypothetical protein
MTLARREVTHWSRSVHFVTGELTRRCQQALRESDGRPMTEDELTIRAMNEKGLAVGDGELLADITRRPLWTANRMMRRKAVVKRGCGAEPWWAYLTNAIMQPDSRLSSVANRSIYPPE